MSEDLVRSEHGRSEGMRQMQDEINELVQEKDGAWPYLGR